MPVFKDFSLFPQRHQMTDLQAEVTISGLASETGKDRRTIEKLIKASGLKPIREEVFAGRLAKYFDRIAALQALEGTQDGDLLQAIQREQLHKLQRENDIADSRVYPAEQVHVTVSEMLAILAIGLEALPGRLASDLAGLSEPGPIRERLRAEITRVRNDAAERFGRLAIDAGAAGLMAAGETGNRSPAHPDIGPVGKRKKSAPKGKRGARAVS